MTSPKYPYSILFVEDETAIRDNYVSYLKIFYTQVYEAKDAEEAYLIYKQKKPHILIMDINLPKLSGIDLLKKIREQDHAVKAIMLTAYADTNTLVEAAGLKLTQYLVKPVSREKLRNALDLARAELLSFDVVSSKKINLRDGYSWDVVSLELSHNDEVVTITNKERKILKLLFSDKNRTFSSSEIIYDVWENYDEGSVDALKTMLKSLRKKLPKEIIKNVFGVGYKINS